MSELEAVYRNARADAEILRLLDQELGHRTTKRASRLRAAVVKARAGRLNSGSGVPPTGGGEGPRTTGSAGVISLPNATERTAPQPAPIPALNSETFASSPRRELNPLIRDPFYRIREDRAVGPNLPERATERAFERGSGDLAAIRLSPVRGRRIDPRPAIPPTQRKLSDEPSSNRLDTMADRTRRIKY
jgi:hypothetical protein